MKEYLWVFFIEGGGGVKWVFFVLFDLDIFFWFFCVFVVVFGLVFGSNLVFLKYIWVFGIYYV